MRHSQINMKIFLNLLGSHHPRFCGVWGYLSDHPHRAFHRNDFSLIRYWYFCNPSSPLFWWIAWMLWLILSPNVLNQQYQLVPAFVLMPFNALLILIFLNYTTNSLKYSCCFVFKVDTRHSIGSSLIFKAIRLIIKTADSGLTPRKSAKRLLA